MYLFCPFKEHIPGQPCLSPVPPAAHKVHRAADIAGKAPVKLHESQITLRVS